MFADDFRTDSKWSRATEPTDPDRSDRWLEAAIALQMKLSDSIKPFRTV